jgi:tetratricopeptide (TPR) repeat protein
METNISDYTDGPEGYTETRYYDTLIEAAVSLRKIGEHRAALRLAKKAIKHEKANPRAHIIEGLIHEDIGEIEKAEASLRKGLEADPENEETLKTLGLFLVNHEKQAEGLNLLCQYIEAGNWTQYNILETIQKLGRELSESNNPDVLSTAIKASKTLRLAWEKTLNHKAGYYYTRFFVSLNDSDPIQILELITKQTNYHGYWNQLGIRYSWKNKNNDAITAYQKAVSLLSEMDYEDFLNEADYPNPIDYEDKELILGIYLTNLASAFQAAGKIEEALQTVETAIEKYEYRFDFFPWEAKINALLSLKRYDDVIDTAKIIISQFEDEDISRAYEAYLEALQNQDRFDDYKKIYLEAVEKYPNKYELYREMAYHLIENHQYSEASDIFSAMEHADIDLHTKGIFAYNHYVLLNIMDQSEKAWMVIRPYAESFEWHESLHEQFGVPEKKIPESSIRYEYLLLGLDRLSTPGDKTREDLFRKLVTQLLEHFPSDPELLATSAYLYIKEKDFEGAKVMLKAGLSTSNNLLKPLFVNNLGYAQMLNGELEEARSTFEKKDGENLSDQQLEVSRSNEEISFLISIWYKNNFQPDPKAKLFLSVPFKIVSAANRVALELYQGNVDHATSLAIRIMSYMDLENQLEDCQYIGNLVIGSVAFAKGEYYTAATAWRKALSFAAYDIKSWNTGDTLISWLDEVEAHLSPQELQDLPPRIKIERSA